MLAKIVQRNGTEQALPVPLLNVHVSYLYQLE